MKNRNWKNQRGTSPGSDDNVKSKMTTNQKEYLLLHLLRMPTLFTRAKNSLKPELFPPEDAIYAAVWESALKIAERSGGLLPEKGLRSILEIETKNVTENDPRITNLEEDELFDADRG